MEEERRGEKQRDEREVTRGMKGKGEKEWVREKEEVRKEIKVKESNKKERRRERREN